MPTASGGGRGKKRKSSLLDMIIEEEIVAEVQSEILPKSKKARKASYKAAARENTSWLNNGHDRCAPC